MRDEFSRPSWDDAVGGPLPGQQLRLRVQVGKRSAHVAGGTGIKTTTQPLPDVPRDLTLQLCIHARPLQD
jgi:hypothetical protein